MGRRKLVSWIPPPPHHNRFTAIFPGSPGWAGARRELLDFMVQGKINRGRHTDHPAGRHSIPTNQCSPPPSPHNFYRLDALLATHPTVSKHWRQFFDCRLELVCPSVRANVCPYVGLEKVFSNFDLISCTGRHPPHVCTSVTLTPSMVKVKVTDLPELQKLHFSKSISSAVLAWSSKLMVDDDSMGPGLQLVRDQFLKFPSRKAITKVQTSPNVDISRHSNGHVLLLCDATVRWLGLLVVLQVLCMLIWPWPDPRSRSRSRDFWTSEN